MSLYHANCQFSVVSLIIKIKIMSFLGFKKAETGCHKSESGCQKAELGCHNMRVNMLSIFTPRGASILPGINNFSHASSALCKWCYRSSDTNHICITGSEGQVNTFAAKHLKKQYLNAKHVSRTPDY